MTESDFVSDEKIQDYIDNRLSERDRAAMAAYLIANPNIAAEVELLRRQNEALKVVGREILDEPVPDRLRFICQPEEPEPAPRRYRMRTSPFVEAVAAIVLFVVGAGVGWFVNGQLNKPLGGPDLIADDLAGIYAFYGADSDYPIDFPPDRTSELVGWFNKTFEREVNPPDLSTLSYNYLGGRLLPAAGKPVGLFKFDAESGDRVLVYFWPGDELPRHLSRLEKQQNISARFAQNDGLSFAVMGTADNDKLDGIADAVFSGFGS